MTGKLSALFITFEGPEGSGKTTQARLLYEYLLEQEYPVVLTREPGGTRISDKVREILLDPRNTEILPRTEILLFSASRAQLSDRFIRPHLQQNHIVICDRYADSTMAYQGFGRVLDLQALRIITDFATGDCGPISPFIWIYLWRLACNADGVCRPVAPQGDMGVSFLSSISGIGWTHRSWTSTAACNGDMRS